MQNITEQIKDDIELKQRELDGLGIGLRVAAPGIIQSVDYDKQTCTVQLAIRERMNFDGETEWQEIPVLPDVPLLVYSGGGYCLTLPVSPGDDCLVVFGDNCMDAWWQNGGVQNQVERRRHDLSDGFAIVGFRSQPNKVSGFSSSSAQLRNASGSACIEISGDSVNIRAGSINIQGTTAISGGTTIDGKSFLGHHHSGVESGGSNTGGVS